MLRCMPLSFLPWSASSTSQPLHFISFVSQKHINLAAYRHRHVHRPRSTNRQSQGTPRFVFLAVSVSVSVSISQALYSLSLLLLLLLYPFTLYLLTHTTVAERPADTNDKPLVFSDPGMSIPLISWIGTYPRPAPPEEPSRPPYRESTQREPIGIIVADTTTIPRSRIPEQQCAEGSPPINHVHNSDTSTPLPIPSYIPMHPHLHMPPDGRCARRDLPRPRIQTEDATCCGVIMTTSFVFPPHHNCHNPFAPISFRVSLPGCTKKKKTNR